MGIPQFVVMTSTFHEPSSWQWSHRRIPPYSGNILRSKVNTLRDEINDAKSRESNSGKWAAIHDELRMLAAEHGHDEAGPWVLVWTAFHGGGLVSRHSSATRAIEKSRKMAGDCTCGCTVVVLAADYDELPTAEEASSPYAAAK